MSIEAALFGTLGRDCERKTSKNGNSYLRLNVACGEGEATQWVSAMVFDERAIAVADKLDAFTERAEARAFCGLSVNSRCTMRSINCKRMQCATA